MYDAIEFRGAAHHDVEQLAAHAGVPVYNGLTDEWHPTQMLADFLTMSEASHKPYDAISYCYMGDAHSNMGRSLLVMGAIMGSDVRICAPRELWPPDEIVQIARDRAAGERRAGHAHRGSGRGAQRRRLRAHRRVGVDGRAQGGVARPGRPAAPYQVNRAAMEKTGNGHAKFMHCLPAYHDRNTVVGRQIIDETGMDDGLEVTDDVFESARSIVFDQAENRLHTIKAVLVATLGSG